MIDAGSGSTTAAVGFTALAVMGAYLCRHRLFCPEPPRSIVEEDDDNEERTPMVKTPVEPPPARRRLRFGDPIQHESPIPRLCDTPRWERERVYWQAHEYAQIRDNQRRLIETVLRSARQCGEGELPPPIPGESRRGLGIACEPSTPSIRAEKIAQHRRGVLAAAAVADGDDVAHLAASLSAEAVAVARQMGDADHKAIMTEAVTPDIPLECLQRRDSLAQLDLFGDSIRLAKGQGIASALRNADPYEMASDLARSDVSVGSYESTRSWKETDAMDSTNYGSSPESF